MHDFTGRGRSLYVYTKLSMENKFSFHWMEPKKHFAESILSLQQQHQLLSQIPIGLTFHPKRVGAISRTRRRDSDSFRNLIWSFRFFFLGDEKSELFFGSVLFVSDPICRFRWFSQDEKCIRYFQSYFYWSTVFILKFLSFSFFLSSLSLSHFHFSLLTFFLSMFLFLCFLLLFFLSLLVPLSLGSLLSLFLFYLLLFSFPLLIYFFSSSLSLSLLFIFFSLLLSTSLTFICIVDKSFMIFRK